MSFDLQDMLAIVNPLTLLGVAAVGVVFGWLFYGHQERRSASWYNLRALLAGELFAAFMAVLRLFEGASAWEGWLGFGILWVAYVAGFAVGSRFDGAR